MIVFHESKKGVYRDQNGRALSLAQALQQPAQAIQRGVCDALFIDQGTFEGFFLRHCLLQNDENTSYTALVYDGRAPTWDEAQGIIGEALEVFWVPAKGGFLSTLKNTYKNKRVEILRLSAKNVRMSGLISGGFVKFERIEKLAGPSKLLPADVIKYRNALKYADVRRILSIPHVFVSEYA